MRDRRRDSERFIGAVGRVVESVVVEVSFYSVETHGHTRGIVVNLAGDAQFVLGCAGDGGILVTRSCGTTKDAPGFSTAARTIDGLSGALQAVSQDDNALKLAIAGHDVVVANQDDELMLTVDGEPLAPQTFKR